MRIERRKFLPGERPRVMLIGVGQIVDGLVAILSFATVAPGIAYAAAIRLAKWRVETLKKKHGTK